MAGNPVEGVVWQMIVNVFRSANAGCGLIGVSWARQRSWLIVLGMCLLAVWTGPAQAQTLPEIRMSAYNRVPTCVTPARLMRYIASRNPNLDPRFRDIAAIYRYHGNNYRVRWDYAFFQMVVETNFLTYKTGSGRWGDVNPRQNNFAGIGTTGGGVPGDGFPDVSTGVLAQIQHLMVYSGEPVPNAVAPRTRLKMDEILYKSQALRRPVTFQDLSGRWAADRAYGRSIQWVANGFFAGYCHAPTIADADERSVEGRATLGRPPFSRPRREDSTDGPGAGRQQATLKTPEKPSPLPSKGQADPAGAEKPSEKTSMTSPTAAPAIATPATKPQPDAAPPQNPVPSSVKTAAVSKPQQAAAPGNCKVYTASFGGSKSVLIEAKKDETTNYTVLGVEQGREKDQTAAFVNIHAKDGKTIGEYASSQLALKKAFELCPKQ